MNNKYLYSVGTFNSFWGIRFRKDVADVIYQIAK